MGELKFLTIKPQVKKIIQNNQNCPKGAYKLMQTYTNLETLKIKPKI